MAQAVEIHVGTAGNRHQCLAAKLFALDVGLETGQRQRTGRLENAAGIFEHVLDGGADGVGIDQDDFVQQLAAQAEGFFTDQLDRRTVGKQADVLEFDPLAGSDGTRHGVRVGSLHADHADLRLEALDVGGYPGGQPAAADGHEHGMDRPRVLAQDFHADGALAGDHVRIVKRRNIGCTSGFGQFDRMQIGVAERVAVQHDPGTA